MSTATVLAFVLALLAVLMFALGARSDVFLPAIPLPGGNAAINLHVSIAVNDMTLLLAALVSFVLMIIARFSIQYLDGDRQQARFFRLLGLTGGWFLLVVMAGNMALFTFSIIMTGFTLHRLLGFYSERPRAIMVTHKKSIFSRTADVLLVVATVYGGAHARIGADACRNRLQRRDHRFAYQQPVGGRWVCAHLVGSCGFGHLDDCLARHADPIGHQSILSLVYGGSAGFYAARIGAWLVCLSAFAPCGSLVI
ncbi:MAG: hypothetical protein B7X12_10875 [Halothiobacillus sp. 20-53-49]|nr:MAG: hypothetical protein B7X12_10875 [Halothiobacillus sp. 20-53-49]